MEIVNSTVEAFHMLQLRDVGILAIEAAVAAVLIFFALSPDWKRLFKNMTTVDLATTSDIPGNPHVLDFSMISALRTLPEPNNFNMVISKVPYDKEVVIEGYMPPARMFSVSAYKKGGSVPESVKLNNSFRNTHKHQFYRIILTKTPEKYKDSKEYDLVVFTHDWDTGMVCIRNYLVPPGTTVLTPRFLLKETGEEIRPPRKVIAGPTNLHVTMGPQVAHQSFMIVAHIACFALANLFVFQASPAKFWPATAVFTVLSLLCLRFIYWILYRIGFKRVKEAFHKGAPDLHTVKLVDVEGKAHDSAPSKLHRYYLMRYDVPVGQELKIQFQVNDDHQDYWSFICYSLYGIPLPNMIYDENVVRENKNKDGSYTVTLYLSNRGTSEFANNDAFHGFGKRNEIDVSSHPCGNILNRIVHPKDEAFVAAAKPKILGLQPIETFSDKKNN